MSYCEFCANRGWLPQYVSRTVDRYVGFFGNDIKPATQKWRADGPREEVTIEVMEAVPCGYCNGKLHNAHLEGRLHQAMSERKQHD